MVQVISSQGNFLDRQKGGEEKSKENKMLKMFIDRLKTFAVVIKYIHIEPKRGRRISKRKDINYLESILMLLLNNLFAEAHFSVE
jgi:hypothetical protein